MSGHMSAASGNMSAASGELFGLWDPALFLQRLENKTRDMHANCPGPLLAPRMGGL